MKRFPWLLLCAVILSRGTAHAQLNPGVDLAWDDCVGSGNEALDKAVACTNSGQYRMVCSFVSPVDLPALGGAQWTLDLQVSSASVLSWWITLPLSSRWGNEVGASSCADIWNQAPSGPTVFGPNISQQSPSRMRLTGGQVVQQGEDLSASAGVRYHSHGVLVKFSPGTADNPGCAGPACIVMNELQLLQRNPAPVVSLQTPSISNYVTWQGQGIPCPQATPVKKATWGEIKALY